MPAGIAVIQHVLPDEHYDKGVSINVSFTKIAVLAGNGLSGLVYIINSAVQNLAKDVSMQLLYMKAMGNDPITIFINSQGGHVEAGDTIHDMIQYIDLSIYYDRPQMGSQCGYHDLFGSRERKKVLFAKHQIYDSSTIRRHQWQSNGYCN
ncbi:ATP-dependent Clp protease proteolytic subunit [Petralouisia muris]|uniref:ATP-dependent Clp protease proteolytic subunit n=1 Tax=Petralouisia muris TaxID=3032872 RepID=UPI0023B7ED1A|nr:ATP-dependent Clp protease proteolytic subunit [Petralouisia muris]